MHPAFDAGRVEVYWWAVVLQSQVNFMKSTIT